MRGVVENQRQQLRNLQEAEVSLGIRGMEDPRWNTRM